MQKIGIIGTQGKTSTLYILEALFHSCRKNVGVIGDYGVRINKNKVSRMDKSMHELMHEMEENKVDYLLIELHDHIPLVEITYDCIICNSTKNAINYDFYRQTIDYSKVIIMNGDDEEALHTIKGLKEIYIITYGLKNKNSITASSLSLLPDKIIFNYYIQRGFKSFLEEEIMVQEIPIELNLISYQHIFNSLAAITTGLFFDISVKELYKALKDIDVVPDKLELYSSQHYTVFIDNSKKIDHLKVIFETLQYLTYKRLIVSIHAENLINILMSTEVNTLIHELNINNIKSVSIVGQCQRKIDKKLIKAFINRLAKARILVTHYESFCSCLKETSEYNNDLLLWIGSRKLVLENIRK